MKPGHGIPDNVDMTELQACPKCGKLHALDDCPKTEPDETLGERRERVSPCPKCGKVVSREWPHECKADNEEGCRHRISTAVDREGCCISCGEDLNYITKGMTKKEIEASYYKDHPPADVELQRTERTTYEYVKGLQDIIDRQADEITQHQKLYKTMKDHVNNAQRRLNERTRSCMSLEKEVARIKSELKKKTHLEQ